MPNQLYRSLNNINPEIIRQFSQFRKTFTGDPKAEVQRLLASGVMSQPQFNEIAQTATQIRNLIK